MAKIVQLEIKNYRGIKSFSAKFNHHLICLIGRGDSGKTSVLHAISCALSPHWNLTFHDTDFYNCDVDNPIEIKVSIVDFPEKFLDEEKYGLYIRGLKNDTHEITDDISDDCTKVITVKLLVDKTLEPRWSVTTGRAQEDKIISASDRAKLNCFLISDYIDNHFSWNTGNPLFSLLKGEDDEDARPASIILDAMRVAKKEIDAKDFDSLETITEKIIRNSSEFGLDISNANTTIDFKDIFVKEGRVSLHDKVVPFRLKGKGSKRIISIAIQSSLVNNGGIMLIDEIEQGLEPDRAKLLAQGLSNSDKGQVFITTHSRDVVTELSVDNLVHLIRDDETESLKVSSFDIDNEELQKVVRACPEAFFAKKVIVCEGATEVGICRALDKKRKNSGMEPMAFKDCAFIDGGGSTFPKRAEEIVDNTSINVSIFCDSDVPVSPTFETLVGKGVALFRCEDGFKIEKQIIADLPWDGVLELLDYVRINRNISEESLRDSIQSKYGQNFPMPWREHDSTQMRNAILSASTISKKEWFKRIDHGEKIGEILYKYEAQMGRTHIIDMLSGLSNWIDN